jgi:hypothetical protein
MHPNSDILPPSSQKITRIDRLARNTREKARPWFFRKPLVASDSNSESARAAAR